MLMTKKAELINIDTNFELAIQKARQAYLEGSVFVYPTDTIYGFGANPFNEEAVKKINGIKRREPEKFYILLVSNIEILLKYIEIKSEKDLDFLLAIWPNPVSVVMRLNSKTSSLLGAGTAAFRIPNNRFCIKLINELQMPVVSTSVNRSGRSPIVDPFLISDEFSSEVNFIFYSDKKCYYEASTLIDLKDSSPVLLREGKMKFDDILNKYQNC